MKKHILGAAIALSTSAVAAETVIVITDSRTEQPVSESLSSVTVISRDEIEQAQANDVAELLRGVVGIDIGRNGGPGQQTSIFTRGTESDHTLVMIDGVAINPGTLGNAALQNINPALIDHIEVVRGPLSSLYGSAAIGGVINIITGGKIAPGSKSHFSAQAGSYNTLSLNAGTRMAEGPFNLSLDLSRQTSDGFPTKASSSDSRGFRNESVNANFGYKLNDKHALQLQAFATRGNAEYLSSGSPVDQDFRNSLLRGGLTSQLSADWESRLTLSRMADFIDQNQQNYLFQYDYAHTTRDVADWQHTVRLSTANQLVAGVTLEREHIDALSYGTSFDINLDNQAVYLQDQYEQGDHQASAALRLTSHETYGDHLTWNLGYGYRLSNDTRLRASAGTAFRAPSGTDLYGYGGNTALEPEESLSFELGAEHALNSHSSVSATAYHTRISNLIVNTGTQNENVDKATISGLELAYSYRQAPWRFSAGAEFKRPWDETHNVVLSRRARVAAKTSLGYSHNGLDLGIDAQYQGKRDDSFWNTDILDGYTLVNATASWKVDSNLTVEGRIENLFDESYELAGGYNTPERSIYLGVRVESD